jgi:hypothetical protein
MFSEPSHIGRNHDYYAKYYHYSAYPLCIKPFSLKFAFEILKSIGKVLNKFKFQVSSFKFLLIRKINQTLMSSPH